jgi:hypothetical protein
MKFALVCGVGTLFAVSLLGCKSDNQILVKFENGKTQHVDASRCIHRFSMSNQQLIFDEQRYEKGQEKFAEVDQASRVNDAQLDFLRKILHKSYRQKGDVGYKQSFDRFLNEHFPDDSTPEFEDRLTEVRRLYRWNWKPKIDQYGQLTLELLEDSLVPTGPIPAEGQEIKSEHQHEVRTATKFAAADHFSAEHVVQSERTISTDRERIDDISFVQVAAEEDDGHSNWVIKLVMKGIVMEGDKYSHKNDDGALIFTREGNELDPIETERYINIIMHEDLQNLSAQSLEDNKNKKADDFPDFWVDSGASVNICSLQSVKRYGYDLKQLDNTRNNL